MTIKITGFVEGEGSEDYPIHVDLANNADAKGSQIKNLKDGVDPQDAATIANVLATFKATKITGDGNVHFTGDIEGHGLLGQPIYISLSAPISAKNEVISDVATAVEGTDAVNFSQLKDLLGSINVSGVVEGTDDGSGNIVTSFPYNITMDKDNYTKIYTNLNTFQRVSLTSLIPEQGGFENFVRNDNGNIKTIFVPEKQYRVEAGNNLYTQPLFEYLKTFDTWKLHHFFDIDMEENKISKLKDPEEAQDAATKSYVDANSGGGGGVTSISGVVEGTDDGSGNIVTSFPYNIIMDKDSFTKKLKLDENGYSNGNVVIPDSGTFVNVVSNDDGFFRTFVKPEGQYRFEVSNNISTKPLYSYAKYQDTWSAAFFISFDMTKNSIKNLLDPEDAQDAATKSYVDANSGGGGNFPDYIEFEGDVQGNLKVSEGKVSLNLSNPMDFRGKQLINLSPGVEPTDGVNMSQLLSHPSTITDYLEISDTTGVQEGTTKIQTNAQTYSFVKSGHGNTFGNIRSTTIESSTYGEVGAITLNGKYVSISSPADTVSGIRALCFFQDEDQDTEKYFKSYINYAGEYIVNAEQESKKQKTVEPLCFLNAIDKVAVGNFNKPKFIKKKKTTDRISKKEKSFEDILSLDAKTLSKYLPEAVEYSEEGEIVGINTTQLIYVLFQSVKNLNRKIESIIKNQL